MLYRLASVFLLHFSKKLLTRHQVCDKIRKSLKQSLQKHFAGMAELADALDSGSSRGSSVKVQVLLPAPPKSLENTGFSRLFAFYFPLSHGSQGMHRLWRCVCLFSVHGEGFRERLLIMLLYLITFSGSSITNTIQR